MKRYYRDIIVNECENMAGKAGIGDRLLLNRFIRDCKGTDIFADLGHVAERMWQHGYRTELLRKNLGASRTYYSHRKRRLSS